MDACIFSIAMYDEVIRTKIYIINGLARQEVLYALAADYGMSTAMLADLQSKRCLREIACGMGMPRGLPQLLYTYSVLRQCHFSRRKTLLEKTFGGPKGLRCDVCGSRSCWGVSVENDVRCVRCEVSEWLEEGDRCSLHLQNR